MKPSCFERNLALSEERSTRLKQLATLATRLRLTGVTEIYPGGHGCHTCHAQKEDSFERIATATFTGADAVWNWLSIVAREGHIEPSQACLGRVIGWPSRPTSARSFWVDFVCWCRKNSVAFEQRPSEADLHQVLSGLFSRQEEHYEIPDLATFRERYNQSRPHCERD